MDELSLLKRMDTVKAPPDFEQRVMARLSLERRAARRRRPLLSLSLAGAFASLLAVFVALNVFVLRDQLSVTASKAAAGAADSQQIIPVIETFDYTAEFPRRAPESGTIYLLEQISDGAPRGTRY
jgi:anti-sigma factor RsiW